MSISRIKRGERRVTERVKDRKKEIERQPIPKKIYLFVMYFSFHSRHPNNNHWYSNVIHGAIDAVH